MGASPILEFFASLLVFPLLLQSTWLLLIVIVNTFQVLLYARHTLCFLYILYLNSPQPHEVSFKSTCSLEVWKPKRSVKELAQDLITGIQIWYSNSKDWHLTSMCMWEQSCSSWALPHASCFMSYFFLRIIVLFFIGLHALIFSLSITSQK